MGKINFMLGNLTKKNKQTKILCYNTRLFNGHAAKKGTPAGRDSWGPFKKIVIVCSKFRQIFFHTFLSILDESNMKMKKEKLGREIRNRNYIEREKDSCINISFF